MRQRRYSKLFAKKLSKLRGQELHNVLNKRDEILNAVSLDHYKNLRYAMSRYKRVQVNSSYVIIFLGDDDIVHFVDYEHHDKVYKM